MAASAGEIDFCLTSVKYFLTARAQNPALAARFVGVVFCRSPIAAIVIAEAPWREPADLADCRVGGQPGDALVQEYQAALARRGVALSRLVPTPYAEAPSALARGEIDAIADFADLVPRVRRQAGAAVRALRVGPELYANGLVAGDHVSHETTGAMNGAVVSALLRQRSQPRAGLDELLRRSPGVDPAEALEGWELATRSIFTGGGVAPMSGARWRATIAYVSSTHALPAVDPESVYRPALAAAS